MWEANTIIFLFYIPIKIEYVRGYNTYAKFKSNSAFHRKKSFLIE